MVPRYIYIRDELFAPFAINLGILDSLGQGGRYFMANGVYMIYDGPLTWIIFSE